MTGTGLFFVSVDNTNGNVLAYDCENNLSCVSNTVSGAASYYWYDSAGRRIAKSENDLLILYIWDGMDIIATAGADGTIREYFTRGAGIAGDVGSLVAETRFENNAPVSTTYLYSNWRGDIVMATDAFGAVVGSYDYTTFGEQLSASGTYTPRFSFSSNERDASGLVYFGFRYCSPVLCRWISEDPIGEAGGINLYQFCGNNPVNGIDADGKAWGAVVLAGLAAYGVYQIADSAIGWWKYSNAVKDTAATRKHGDWLCEYGAEHGDVDVYNAGVQEIQNALYLAGTGANSILNTPGTTLTGPPPFVDIPLTSPSTSTSFAPLLGRPGYQHVNGYNRANGTYVPPHYRRLQGSDMPRPDNNLYPR